MGRGNSLETLAVLLEAMTFLATTPSGMDSLVILTFLALADKFRRKRMLVSLLDRLHGIQPLFLVSPVVGAVCALTSIFTKYPR